MKRRGFFGALAGLFLAPLGLNSESPQKTVGVGFNMEAGTGRFVTAAEVQRIEDAMWDPPSPGRPYGISYWLMR